MGDANAASDRDEVAESAPRERDPSNRRDPAESTPSRPRQAPPASGDFGWHGWVLVGVMGVCFLVVPAAIVAVAYRPGLLESVGMGFRDAYLVLPTIPALALAITAVWAAVRARRD